MHKRNGMGPALNNLRFPGGIALVIAGSGLYWVLSSQLIASFTVLAPEALRTVSYGTTLVLVVGVFSTAVGLWIIPRDLEELWRLLNESKGWLFSIPTILVSMDLFLTVIGLAPNSKIIELNPFVYSAVAAGTVVLISFIISYIALSQGIGLFMLDLGSRFFGTRSSVATLPYSAICGVASIGPLSNLVLVFSPSSGLGAYLASSVGAFLLSALVFSELRNDKHLVALS